MVLRKLRRRGNTTKIKRIERESQLQEKIDNKISSDEDIEELEVRIGRENSYNRDGAKLQLQSWISYTCMRPRMDVSTLPL